MTGSGIGADQGHATRDPRNLWRRLIQLRAALAAGDLATARAGFEGLRHHDGLGPGLRGFLEANLQRAEAASPWLAPLHSPNLLLSDARLAPLRPSRRLPPAGKPGPGLALPDLPHGPEDIGFIRAAARLPGRVAPGLSLLVVLSGPALNATSLLRAQLTHAARRLECEARGPVRLHWLEAGQEVGPDALAACDQVLFLEHVLPEDPTLLLRADHLGRLGARLVQVLVTAQGDGALMAVADPQPQGLSMLLPAELLREVGLPEVRLISGKARAIELMSRCSRAGAWCAGIGVPGLQPMPLAPADLPLLAELCPERRDLSVAGQRHEVARLAIWMPARNATRFIRAAIDSLLDQDMQDLVVGVAIDGDDPDLEALLAHHYAAEPRVIWQSGPRGGIGHASNRAVALTRSLYLGQLDADDRVKSGALSRLVQHLDAHPELVGVYSSSERIDRAGRVIGPEYAWPDYSREKLMVTSIVHHFRLFRRAALRRAGPMREDILNAVDHDLHLRLAELGPMQHLPEILHQRRWHGGNISHLGRAAQDRNTARVQEDALMRPGLSQGWRREVPDFRRPREAVLRLRPGRRCVVFWPDYSRANDCQRLLYADLHARAEVVAGDLGAALDLQARLAREGGHSPCDLVFHLHWLDAVLRGAADVEAARARAERFTAGLRRFVAAGGRLVFTMHNLVGHDTPWPEIEAALLAEVVEIAQVIHLHSAASIPEIERLCPLPRARIRIARHGSWRGLLPDWIRQDEARAMLELPPEADVIVHSGQMRPYKGVDALLAAFRALRASRPMLRLILAGEGGAAAVERLTPALNEDERAAVTLLDRRIEDEEWQLVFRAADVGIWPYRRILTSGSVMLGLSFGVPVIAPGVGMVREAMGADREGRARAGILLDPEAEGADCAEALARAFALKDAGQLAQMAEAARACGARATWEDMASVIFG